MTLRLTVSCDGHRDGQPCRGAFHSRWITGLSARADATAAGWRTRPAGGDLCPSGGHDEEGRP